LHGVDAADVSSDKLFWLFVRFAAPRCASWMPLARLRMRCRACSATPRAATLRRAAAACARRSCACWSARRKCSPYRSRTTLRTPGPRRRLHRCCRCVRAQRLHACLRCIAGCMTRTPVRSQALSVTLRPELLFYGARDTEASSYDLHSLVCRFGNSSSQHVTFARTDAAAPSYRPSTCVCCTRCCARATACAFIAATRSG
jgi:hypothetical protein